MKSTLTWTVDQDGHHDAADIIANLPVTIQADVFHVVMLTNLRLSHQQWLRAMAGRLLT